MASSSKFDADGARKAGYSDAEIIDHLQPGSAAALTQHAGGASAQPAAPPPAAPEAPDTSLSGALGYGVDNTAHSLGNTADVLGLPNVGKALKGANMAPKGYQPVSLTGDIGAGKWSSLPGDIVRKGVEMLPAVGGMAAAGAMAPEALGTAGALGAAGLASGALHYGDNVKAAQANDGNAEPSTSNYVRGAVTTLPQAAIDAVGLRVPGLSKAAGPVGSALVRTGADAAAAGASDVVGQVGNSIGTDKGLQYNPQQTAEAMLGTLPARAMTQAPGLVKAGVKSGSDAAMSRMVDQPTDVDHAAAIEQANQAIDNARQAANGKPQPKDLANSAKSEVAANLRSTFTDLRKNFPDQVTAADAANFTEVMNQARRHNNVTGDGSNPDIQTLLDQMGSLDLPKEATAPLVQGLRALDVLSNASFANQQVGPFRAVGQGIANAAAIASPLVAGHIPGGIEAGIGLALGHNIAGKMGGAIGGKVDQMMGTNTPVAVLQRAAAQRMLQANNVQTPGDPVAALQAVRAGIRDVAPQVQTQAAAPNTAAQNQAASAAYGNAQQVDGAAMARQAAQAQALKQKQIEAAYQQNAQPQQAPTSAPDYARAQAQLPQPADPTAAYMAGKAIPGMDGTAPLGSQTAAEIAGWTQMQRNKATALAQAQKVMKTQPDIAGQLSLDKQARANNTTLAAAATVPTTKPGITDVASDAAVAQALAKANRVMKLAGVEPVNEVGNKPDPVPVNTPIPASKAPPAAPQAAPLQPQPAQAPQAPTAAPGPPQGTPTVRPWERYILNGSSRLNLDHVDQAIDEHVAAGDMTPQQAQALRNHPGIEQSSILAPIQARALRIAGVGAGPDAVGLPQGTQGFGPAPADKSVKRPAAYLYATQEYHLDAGRLADAAKAAGMPNVADVVEDIQHTVSPMQKGIIRDHFLLSLPEGQREAASRFLPDRLVNHGKSK